MERPIGDKFIYDNVELEVVPDTNDIGSVCKGCFFYNAPEGCIDSIQYRGICFERNDCELVIFRRVE